MKGGVLSSLTWAAGAGSWAVLAAMRSLASPVCILLKDPFLAFDLYDCAALLLLLFLSPPVSNIT